MLVKWNACHLKSSVHPIEEKKYQKMSDEDNAISINYKNVVYCFLSHFHTARTKMSSPEWQKVPARTNEVLSLSA